MLFRVYREVTVPLYADMVAQICASSNVPLELVTTLEDIGQEFIGFAATLNEELQRRGALDDVADADQTVEARIDALVDAVTEASGARRVRGKDRARAFMSEPASLQALKTALTMIWDLPSAQRPLRKRSVRAALRG